MIATRPAARPGRAGVARYLVSIAYELRRSRRHTQRTLSVLVRLGLLEREHGQRLPSAGTDTGWSTDGPTRYQLTGGPADTLWRTLELPDKTDTPGNSEEDAMGRRHSTRAGAQPPPAREVISELRDGRGPPPRVYWTADNPIFHTYMYCLRHDLMYRDCTECRRIALALIRGS